MRISHHTTPQPRRHCLRAGARLVLRYLPLVPRRSLVFTNAAPEATDAQRGMCKLFRAMRYCSLGMGLAPACRFSSCQPSAWLLAASISPAAQQPEGG